MAQNSVTGRPLTENVAASALQGAAMMGAMHLGTSAFFSNLSQAVDAARESELRQRAPWAFQDATQTIMRGTLRFPAQEFNDYFAGQSLDPAAVAGELGATTNADGEVEVPKASFFGKLDPVHQTDLLPSVIDPNSGRTFSEYEASGPQRWLDKLSQTEPEIAASPEWQAVKQDMRQRLIDEGRTPEDAESLATIRANVIANLGRNGGIKPSELLNPFNPEATPEGSGESAANGSNP